MTLTLITLHEFRILYPQKNTTADGKKFPLKRLSYSFSLPLCQASIITNFSYSFCIKRHNKADNMVNISTVEPL